jgi:hypothetical protein
MFCKEEVQKETRHIRLAMDDMHRVFGKTVNTCLQGVFSIIAKFAKEPRKLFVGDTIDILAQIGFGST